jgi:multimeric flavodoxin WrbA
MTIVAIVASPRKKGNSCTIVKAIADGAKANGKSIKVYHLNSLTNVKGCQACMACKASGACVVKDDHAEILKAIKDAEGIILSTPFYFGDSNGQYRLLEDRFYSFLKPDFSTTLSPGKKVAVVVSCGSGADGAKALANKIEGTMVNYFKFVSVGKIVFGGGNAPDAASKNAAILDEAKAIGKKF